MCDKFNKNKNHKHNKCYPLIFLRFLSFEIDDEDKENNPENEEILWLDRNEEEELSEDTEQSPIKDSALKILGIDPNDNKFKNHHQIPSGIGEHLVKMEKRGPAR